MGGYFGRPRFEGIEAKFRAVQRHREHYDAQVDCRIQHYHKTIEGQFFCQSTTDYQNCTLKTAHELVMHLGIGTTLTKLRGIACYKQENK